MSDDSKSFEKKLDRDFLFYLNLTKALYDRITNDTEKRLCEVWLTHLVGKNFCSLNEKCNRNIFLSRLLLQMQTGKLQGIFLDTPPNDGLLNAFETFGLPSEVDGVKGFEQIGFQIDNTIGIGSGDFSESSRDGRTYLATRRLPQGMMAYIAVTNNDGEEIWKPQPCLYKNMGPISELKSKSAPDTSEFVKRLSEFVKMPLSQIRKSPEDREKVIEWLDKVINDCNKWIQGEDPHNMDLESLFEMMYQDYKNDPDKAEILKHPKKLRTVLIRDIRDKITEKRAEVSKRELILDQYESDQYVEERYPGQNLDEVWLQCAKKPLSESTRLALEAVYPPEVIKRFFELLFQERIFIIEKGEKDANRKIAELRSGSMDDIKKELLKLKKIQQDYKDYYNVHEEAELRAAEYSKEWKEKCTKGDRSDYQQKCDRLKRELECQIEQTKKNFDKERKTQTELLKKLEEAKEAFFKVEEKIKIEGEKINCEKDQLQARNEEIQLELQHLRKNYESLKCKLMSQNNPCAF